MALYNSIPTCIQPLALFDRRREIRAVLVGAEGRNLHQICMEHTVHRQAVYGVYSSVQCYSLVWTHPTGRVAAVADTPLWAHDIVMQAVRSLLSVGYIVFRVVEKAVIINVAPPGMFDLEFVKGEWRIKEAKHRRRWQLIMWAAPRYDVDANVYVHGSAAQGAEKSTRIYDELYVNIRDRDAFNSKPSVFTVVDPALKSIGNSGKSWFRTATAASHAGMRPPTVTARTFKSLVNGRSDAIRELKDATTSFRKDNSYPTTKSPATEDGVQIKDNDGKLHAEHVVTDGKTTQPARALLSLTDGFQLLRQSSHDIFWHYGVPPQITGQNINAERSGINPRLNEVVLTQFFQTVTRIRAVIEHMFDHLVIAKASLRFAPVLSPYDLDQVKHVLLPGQIRAMYAATYDIPVAFFKAENHPVYDALAGTDSNAGVPAEPRQLHARATNKQAT